MMATRTAVMLISAFIGLTLSGACAEAGPSVAPTQLVMWSNMGSGVDKVTGESVCMVASGHQCQSGKPVGGPGGFNYPSSVATDQRTGNLYVADLDNYRVQEFTASGVFLRMFGWGVNKSNDRRAKATRAEKNVCTAVSGDLCTSGLPGLAAGQLAYATSITVDPATGDVYVLEIDIGDYRVDKYTADGRFVWMVGKNVNETTKGNICSEHEIERSGVRCEAGRENGSDSLEHAAFKFAQQDGNLLAVGGPEHLLYVGDEHRVQEFDTDGRWRGEVLLTSLSAEKGSSVEALAVGAKGDLYLVYAIASPERGGGVDDVRRFDPRGNQIGQFSVAARLPGANVHIDGIALDSSGRMAVIGVEARIGFYMRLGSLYEPNSGRLVGEFAPPRDNDGLTFNRGGDLYVAGTDHHEVVAYVPGSLTALVTGPVACGVEPGLSTDASFECALERSNAV